MPKTDGTCPRCGVSSDTYAKTGNCPACTYDMSDDGRETLRERLIWEIEQGFRLWAQPNTRRPGTEGVDVPELVDLVLRETGEWITEQMEQVND